MGQLNKFKKLNSQIILNFKLSSGNLAVNHFRSFSEEVDEKIRESTCEMPKRARSFVYDFRLLVFYRKRDLIYSTHLSESGFVGSLRLDVFYIFFEVLEFFPGRTERLDLRFFHFTL